MMSRKQCGILAAILAVVSLGAMSLARADEPAAGKTAAFWTVQKESGKLVLLIPGQKDPVVTAVSDTTIFGGVCQDCGLPLEFKPGESAKNCNVCGCAVSNVACIIGKPTKTNTWQAMLKTLPVGTVLQPTFNEADKPESGLKKLVVSLRAVLLPVSGLEGQTPDQLLTLLKPLGGTKAELLDGGKLLSVSLKSNWTVERETKLVAELAKVNAKILAAEEPKAEEPKAAQ